MGRSAAFLAPLLACAVAEPEALVRKEVVQSAQTEPTIYRHGGAAGASADAEDAWHIFGHWLAASGEAPDARLAARPLVAAGLAERSLVAAGGHLPKGTVLAEVPKQMWIHLDNFPLLQRANLTQLPECSAMPDATLTTLKLAAAVAVETKKGNRSWFEAYLQQLPTFQDYHNTYPSFAGPVLLADFEALPLIRLVKHMHKVDDQLRICFQAWQQSGLRQPGALGGDGPPEFAQLHWADVTMGLMHVRTRGRSVSLGNTTTRALVPGTDFVNAALPASVNTRSAAQSDSANHSIWRLSAAADVPAGGELREEYCSGCHNDAMMLLWGIYLDNNPNHVDLELGDLDPDYCMPVSRSAPLRDVVLGAFELDRSPEPLAPSYIFMELLRAGLHRASAALGCPPLAAKGPASEQAPLRCSLARLALEHCAETWAAHDFSSEALPRRAALLEEEDALIYGNLSFRDAAHAALASGIGAVQTQLLFSAPLGWQRVPAAELLQQQEQQKHGDHGGQHKPRHHGAKEQRHRHGGDPRVSRLP